MALPDSAPALASVVELIDAFAAGAYVLFGIIHANLWMRRRERVPNLWLALAAGSALVVNLTGLVMRRAGGGPPWMTALNFFGVGAATVCLAELSAALERRRAGPVARGLEAVVLVLAPATGGLQVQSLFALTLVGCGSLLLLALLRALRAAYAGQPGAGTVARGFVVLAACLIFDVLGELQVLPHLPGLAPAGFIVLFLASAKALADRQDEERRELDDLRHDLERRVDERTVALQEVNERLAVASRTAALTGLPNRRGFVEVCATEVERFRRTGRPFSIVLADVDHFKSINDRFGHAAGDEALCVVANAVRASLRAQDRVARWGGEEFILLLPDTPASGALHAAESARQQVAASAVEIAGESRRLTMSLGVAEHRGDRSLDATIAAADRALYRAKEAGRDRVVAE